MLETGGRHGAVLRLLPPLIITDAEVDRVVEIVGDACAATVADGATAHVIR
jgi:diaminobutyrate-2-oxoglutarate transaminase